MGSRQEIEEGKAKIRICGGVFYNPHMRLCRDLTSLCAGAIGKRISVADVMCATGARGIRYKLENRNVDELSLSDISQKAAACARKNAKLNNLECKVSRADAKKFMRENSFDFLELDPFGSPQPFLHDAAHMLHKAKESYFSVTATDMPVLCGAHLLACLKNYGANPLNNEFCHENAARILIGRTAMEFAPFSLSATPIFTLSHRHYIKIVFLVQKGAQKAASSIKSLGFVSYCPSCCWRQAERFPEGKRCPSCAGALQIAGPMHLGELWDRKIAQKMLSLNKERGLHGWEEAGKILGAINEELAVGSCFYWDLHTLAKKTLRPIIPIQKAIESLRDAGYKASRTHFCPTAIRADAPHEEILRLVRA
ncbi:MAG: tRNA (guanine(10)-N(2))-dimethyltransferase [Candidatus Micrarchaeota archaeon]|nr:tRNA (guanine(10)-N(2))-dimethyltransferase [Candidatus Micrarchaeota archaeon]